MTAIVSFNVPHSAWGVSGSISHTKFIKIGIVRAILGVENIVRQIHLTHLVHRNDDGGVVEIVPQAGIGCVRPSIPGKGCVSCYRHQNGVDLVVVEQS